MLVTSPLTREQLEKRLDNPALCEQLPVRDYLDNVLVRELAASGLDRLMIKIKTARRKLTM
jgi:hypothetical protein